MARKKTAIIVGGGPAGLTVALELIRRTDIHPIVLESSDHLGGISKTIDYRGNKIDIGGHRFFSKSDRVMDWWLDLMPLEKTRDESDDSLSITYQNSSRSIVNDRGSLDPDKHDAVMLIRKRLSRIYYLGKFFDYPVSPSVDTVRKLGLFRTGKIGFSYLWALIRPIKKEESLEDFFINRFGRELYATFFRDYTYKVWGKHCREIEPEWGAQRVKGLSIKKAITHACKKLFKRSSSVRQQDTETSLIEKFLYPKFGPGQLWELVGEKIVEGGGTILREHRVERFAFSGETIRAVTAQNVATGETLALEGDYFFSSMPVRSLIRGFETAVPSKVANVASSLEYRDFITVGLLLKKLHIVDEESQRGSNNIIPDNWIYLQDSSIRAGRMQVFNNWSPYLVVDPDSVWIGLEYFCDEGDELWSMEDKELVDVGMAELEKMEFASREDFMGGVAIKVKKAYPSYWGAYKEFDVVKEYVSTIENLFLIGRNGMHRYNNQDHSMLTAMVAVDNIVEGRRDKSNIWGVNTETEYHEKK